MDEIEALMARLAEFVSSQIDEVDGVTLLDKEMGSMMYIDLRSGKRVLLTLVDSKL